MRRLFILALLFLLISISSYSNGLFTPKAYRYTVGDTIIVKGTLVDAMTKEPLSLLPVTIKIDHQKEYSVILDSKGRFALPLLNTVTEITIEAVNYNDTNIVIKKDGNEAKIGKVLLSKIKELSEVTIKDTVSNVKQEPFKRTYKVQPLKTNEAPVIKSFIKTLPEITFVGDKFVVDGSKDAVFYLNGVRTNSDVILNLPVDLIDKVEVISNPAMLRLRMTNTIIINVVTKREDAATYGSSNSISGAIVNKFIGGTVEPYYSKKDLLVTFSANTYKNNSRDKFTNTWKPLDAELNTLIEDGISHNVTKPIFLSGFIQKDLAKKIQLSINLDYSNTIIEINRELNSTSLFNSKSSTAFNELVRIDRSTKDYSGALELAYKGDKTSLFLNFGGTNSRLKNKLFDDITGAYNGALINDLNNKSIDYSAQISLEHTFSDKVSSRFGVVYSWRDVDSELGNFSDGSVNGQIIKSNTSYNEKTYGAFGSMSLNFPIATIDLGVREELSRNFNEGKLYYDRYLFVPQIYIYRKFKKYGTFNLSAYREIDTPNQLFINSAYTSTNLTNANFGNTKIDREAKNKIDLTHNIALFKKFRVSFNTNIYYTNTENLISNNGYRYDDGRNFFYRQQTNVGSFSSYGLYIGATKSFKKLGYVKLGGGINRQEYDLKDSVNLSKTLANIRSSFTLNFAKNYTANFAFSYRNYSISPYTVTSIRPDMSLTFTGKLIKDILYAEVYWTNMFNVNGLRESDYHSYYVDRHSSLNQLTQNVSFSVTYMLGKKKDKDASSNRSIEKQGVKAEN